jgi:hypothetical protein
MLGLGLNIIHRQKINSLTPPSVGEFGFLPPAPSLTFSHASGNILGSYFDCLQDGLIFMQRIRAFKNTAGTMQMRAGIYTKTGASDGNALVQSADVLNLSNVDTDLEFSLSKACLNGSSYWLLFQGNNDWTFYYKDAPAVQVSGRFIFVGNFGIGAFPASFAGAATFDALQYASAQYYY